MRRFHICVGAWTRVQFRVPPPFTQKPTVIGWFFSPVSPQCWRGFLVWPRERHPSKPCVFAPANASLFAVFSGGLASVRET